jgi:hypothetical protein
VCPHNKFIFKKRCQFFTYHCKKNISPTPFQSSCIEYQQLLICAHSDHSKTWHSKYQNHLISRHICRPFLMVFYHPISGPVFKWSASLDHFT